MAGSEIHTELMYLRKLAYSQAVRGTQAVCCAEDSENFKAASLKLCLNRGIAMLA